MEKIKLAAQRLKDGFLVAFPTETVYGLGADATNEDAVARIFKVKNRPSNHPLIVHLGVIEDLKKWAIEIPDYAFSLADKYWPGPMTLILKRNPQVNDFVTGGQNTIGIRIPNNDTALSLINEFRKIGSGAIAAPSANKFGKVSPTSFNHVHSELKNDLLPQDIILDGGDSEIGIESTIIDCTNRLPKILRLGAVTSDLILKIIEVDSSSIDSNIRFSGSFKSHYAPNAKVILDGTPLPGDGFIALKDIDTPNEAIRISSPENIEDFARELYSSLRKADELNLKRVIVRQPNGSGLAEAIRDRLSKASY